MRRPASPSALLVVLVLLAPAWPAFGQDPAAGSAAAPSPVEAGGDSAPVVVDGRRLFVVAGVTAFPAKQRAEAIATRIRELARDASFDPATIVQEDGERETVVMAGGRRLFRLFEVDAELEGVDRRIVAEVSVTAVRQAILDFRAARTPEAIASAIWRAAGATLAIVLTFLVVIGIFRAMYRRIERRIGDRLRSLAIGSYELVRAERLWGLVRGLTRVGGSVTLIFCSYLYLNYLLRLFPATRGAAAQLDDWVLAPIAVLGRGLLEKVPDLIFLLVLWVIVRYLLSLVSQFFAAIGRGEVEFSGFDRDWAEPTYKLVRLAIVAFGLIVAYPYIPGSSSAAFKGVSIFLGVVFSLSSSSAIANVLAGYSLTYRRAFREGDRVKIAGLVGDVSKIRLQATYLRTPKNEEVVVPNSTILASEVVNYSTLASTRGLILHTTVGIGYETPWRQVEAMLLEAARRTPGLLAEPQPFVLQLALADFAVTYEINVACDDPQAMGPLYTELHRNILDVFNEYGVQIMTPAYEGDPEVPKVVPRDQWHLPPAAKP